MVITHGFLHAQSAMLASVPASALAMQQLVVSPASDETPGHVSLQHNDSECQLASPHERKLTLLLQQSCQVKLSLNTDPLQATVTIEIAATWCLDQGANFLSKDLGKEHKFEDL